ncbi:transketolase [Actinomycetospora chiangmaiensis]|uniref:transketolase n=1 Tax=Actinomycetospora chiangmaiensis TaxID=402650 RepID=UPI0003794E1B|nr:hypothetical protein [Actinomycetospora chiangmaiensis]
MRTGLADSARNIRRYALEMGEVQGQGYIGQALGVADVLAVLFGHVLRFRPDDPAWAERDRFLLSVGHYAIAAYAAFAEAGIVEPSELADYGADGSSLPMSAMASSTPGMEISGGSLGHGLGIATGMGLGLRHRGSSARVVTLLSDGELDEGSTWEAAMACAQFGLANVLAVVDVNGLQADGATVLASGSLVGKWEAFGWTVRRTDGHDLDALVTAFDELTAAPTGPSILLADTRPGRGVPMFEDRERAHFLPVREDEWAQAREQLT